MCDDSWDINYAVVVCRQLGCGRAISAHSQAFFGVGTGQFWMKFVNCVGTESFISECSLEIGRDCDHSKDAGVVCSGMRISVLPWSKCLFASMHWDLSLFVSLCLSVFARFNLCDRLEHEQNRLQFLCRHTKLLLLLKCLISQSQFPINDKYDHTLIYERVESFIQQICSKTLIVQQKRSSKLLKY